MVESQGRNRTPALIPGWGVFRQGNGDVLLARDRRRIHLNPPHGVGVTSEDIVTLLDWLDGSRAFDDLIRMALSQLKWPEMMTVAFLERLFAEGIVLDRSLPVPKELSVDDLIRFDRQLSFFAEFEGNDVSRYDYQIRLRQSKIVVIGLGGAGNWLLSALAGTGIGTIVGVDGDFVEESNLDRQILFFPEDVGAMKAEVAKIRVETLRPGTKFEAVPIFIKDESDVVNLLNGVSLVVLYADNPPREIRRIVTRACLARGVPLLSQLGPWLGPLCIPYKTACYGCYEVVARRQDPDDYESIAVSAEARAPWPRKSKPGINALMAGYAAWEIVAQLTGFTSPITHESMISVAIESGAATTVPLDRQPNCDLCGVGA